MTIDSSQQTKILNSLGQEFVAYLRRARDISNARETASSSGEKVHVVGVGGTITAAYEQLRNAAEYAEEHLLLQRAIRRFYRRLFVTRDVANIGRSGEDVIVELTQAGYLSNDSVTIETVARINQLAQEYFQAYMTLGGSSRRREAWTIEVLASRVEELLSDHSMRAAYLQFAYDYFLTTLDQKTLFQSPVDDFEAALFIALHRTLLKSDNATIRTSLLTRYQQTPTAHEAYKKTNQQIDAWLESPTAEKLYRVTNRQGAPFRIIWRMLDERQDISDILTNPNQFLPAYEAQIQAEYERTEKRINRGIIKSVIFLIITKVLIGLAIEIPYDNIFHGSILWLPLAINLLFPPIYMILLRATLAEPGPSNTRALVDKIETILYTGAQRINLTRRTQRGFGMTFNIVYTVFFVTIFGLVAWYLTTLGFTLLHLLIFFVFMSTASFLGFRLSRQIRELEVGESEQDILTFLRDFLYLPFVTVGRYLSEKYAQVNLVATVLDMVIELPLKTVLRLIRQWGAFLSSKKDEL